MYVTMTKEIQVRLSEFEEGQRQKHKKDLKQKRDYSVISKVKSN